MIDQTINGYTIKRLIGSGGMAEVYYAENSLGLPAAVKVLKREYSLNSQITERFMNEAKIMKSLHHPHIRKVMDLSRLEEQPCILMEYLEGETLKEVMGSHNKVNDSSLQKYFDQCAQALIYTHSRGITHRDIKPSNIFITKEGVVKLVDFGIAKSELGISHTLTGQTLGTVIYMSPEQVVDPKRVTGKTDIYSLGVTFYHALIGKSPYDATTGSEFTIQQKIVYEDLDLKLIPSHWRPVLAGCLQKKPEDRKKLKAKNFDEETLVEDGKPPTPGPSTPKPPSTGASHNWLYFLIGGLVLAVGLIFGMRSCGAGSDLEHEEQEILLEKRLWNIADSVDSKDFYEIYLREFPSGLYSSKANSRIAELKKEDLEKRKFLITSNSVGFFNLGAPWRNTLKQNYPYEFVEGYGTCVDAACNGGYTLGFGISEGYFGPKIDKPILTIVAELFDTDWSESKHKDNPDVFFMQSPNMDAWYWKDKIDYMVVHSDLFKTSEGLGVGTTLGEFDKILSSSDYYIDLGWINEDGNAIQLKINSYPNIAFVLSYSDYKGDWRDLENLYFNGDDTNLKISDFKNSAKIQRVIVNPI